MTDFKALVDIFVVLGYEHMRSLHVDTRIRAFLDLELVGVFGFTQKVFDFFFVNFNETASYEVFFGRLVLGINDLKYMFESSWHDTSLVLVMWIADHCVRLTASCLTVREDRG